MNVLPLDKSAALGRVITALLLLIGLASPYSALAEEVAAPREKIFPGLNEVVPQATAVAARVSEAEAQIKQAGGLEGIYADLDEQVERLKKLEEQYNNWEEVGDWQLNRLLSAQASYTDLSEQQEKPLDTIYTHLKDLEELRISWDQEKAYWKEWQVSLRKIDVKVPREAFRRTLASIDELLRGIAKASGVLVKSQQKYSPTQEIITSRLSLIDKTHDTLRQDSFRRSTYSLFEIDYYRQFTPELYTDFSRDLVSTWHMPDGFFKRHGWIITLQLISTIIITLLLIFRKKQQRPLPEEWTFLVNRPLSGAIFITMIAMNSLHEFYANSPLSWRWLLLVIVTIAATRLLKGIYLSPLPRRVISIIAFLFILTEGLQVFGLPTPLTQLYQVVLCALAVPLCGLSGRKYRTEGLKQLATFYTFGAVAIVGLTTAALGFVTLSTNVINASLSTFIVFVLLKMALRMADGGIRSFMTLSWMKDRHFMQHLGLEEAKRRLQTLVRIIILVNTGTYLLVVWTIFDNQTEARQALLDYQYNLGELTISIEMVVMIVIVLYLTSVFSWIVQAFVDSQIMTPRKMDRGVKESLKSLTHYGLFTIGFLIAVSMAGLDLQKFTILAGALGVGIGFGLQNIVNNFVSGLILLFERPVKIGDTISLDEEWGVITKIGLRSTVCETFDRSEIIVPNADLVSQKVTNWTFSSKIVRVNLPVGVAYGSPLEKVLEILNRAAREHNDVLSYPEPTSIFEGFGNSSIDFKLRFWVHTVDDRMRVRTEVAVIIDRLFREEDITIPFPQQDLHLRSIDSNLQASLKDKSLNSDSDTETEGSPE
jgi:small-conductance mechanosensitive channel